MTALHNARCVCASFSLLEFVSTAQLIFAHPHLNICEFRNEHFYGPRNTQLVSINAGDFFSLLLFTHARCAFDNLFENNFTSYWDNMRQYFSKASSLQQKNSEHFYARKIYFYSNVTKTFEFRLDQCCCVPSLSRSFKLHTNRFKLPGNTNLRKMQRHSFSFCCDDHHLQSLRNWRILKKCVPRGEKIK